MTSRLPAASYQKTKGEGNKRLLKKMVAANEYLGVIAYTGKEPIAWCSVSPKERLLQQKNSRLLRLTENTDTWSIVCLFILPAWRRKGVSSIIIEGAYQYAISKGARIVEAYPVIPRNDKMPDVFAWTGIWKSYQKAGFIIAGNPSESKYIMQRKE